ncbi:DoxX family protein [Mucilaginibacter boryungensis]|uniref:DoxX family protein n=1 Tax=Mucilaginibacter boryungensis TaxID=768480 RepID=A0ABR9XNS0_9SPHI|nr:DoxX family protein [Mucilaginibacter boryungensis]MBE9668653.1 DoxX family protein [Mucilaginibacter boryungensis]
MKKTNIICWISTVLICLVMGGGGIVDAMATPEAVKMVHDQLGYPVYFVSFIGVAKVLGSIVLLIPGFPKLKEWAYAGFTFDLIGATYSSLATGATVTQAAPMLIFFALLAVSYIYYHKRLAAKAAVNN